ncbi:MAG: glycosyltransferase [Anaerolineales bacterium]|jgi:GT2 family glycosyltransferase/glycosyltransferase involved in cell wall biosynthesis|nr:glycosyltransferase [Anaerolineales bacterium]
MSNPSPGSIRSIAYFTNHGHDPCAYLRLRSPLRNSGIMIIEGKEEGITYPERASQGDLVLIQRDFPRDLPAYEQIVALARQEKKPVVFEIDDLLLFLPETHPERKSQHYTESLLPMLQAIEEADFVTVTTGRLQEDLRQFNPNILLLPNFLDDAIWEMRPPCPAPGTETPLVIGYMGSESHMPDVEALVPVIEELLHRYPVGVRFHFWGVRPPTQIATHPQVTWIPAQTYEYEDFARYFLTQQADIFIAPLADNAFNRAKSPLKFFEYSALGAPGVYSRLEPFEQVITDGQDGLLAASQEEWVACLARLIEDPALRYQVASRAQETIRSKWLLSQNQTRWQAAYAHILQEYNASSGRASPAREVVKSINRQYYELNKLKDQHLRQKEQELAFQGQELELKEQALAQKAQELLQRGQELAQKDQSIQALSFELAEIKVSKAWKIALMIRRLRVALIPPNTRRARFARAAFHWLQGKKIRYTQQRSTALLDTLLEGEVRITACQELKPHQQAVDVIVCVHNALDDVRRCLESVVAHTTDPFSLIVVDDGSAEPTRDYLSAFATAEPRCQLLRNETAVGYTLAANIGMRRSTAPYLVLLNSDTIVGPEWVDRMVRAMQADDKIGVVGPLSNTASWQSIPKLSENGDWAINTLPPNTSVAQMSQWIARYSACILPQVPLLNGFCLMIRRALIDEIGIFDEETFGRGYGEEDDFNLRAGDAGWKKAIADDVYIFHAQSKSYSNARRYELARKSGEALQKKHGVDKIAASVAFMNPNRVMEGIRSRTPILVEREEILARGRQMYAGKKLLFVLPVIDAGGGANVIIDEARYMLQMGVEVRLFNLSDYKAGFLQSYPHLDIPTIFGEAEDLPRLAAAYDAVVASANYSVAWLKPLEQLDPAPILGYYIQGFEPLMYPDGSEPAQQALATYTMLKGCRRFTKTLWTRNMVYQNTGADSAVVGISVNIDLFRPRHQVALGQKPVTITAMVRPSSHYRNPQMTLSILRQVEKRFGKDVNIWLFGANEVREVVDEKYLDFNWRQLGKLTQPQVAAMLSKADIFTDFSSHQAMGLTALEAMSAGCCVIVPQNGGAVEFIRHQETGLVADTANEQANLHALEELVENDALRKQLQLAGMQHVVQYYPEKVSYNILKTLFDE